MCCAGACGRTVEHWTCAQRASTSSCCLIESPARVVTKDEIIEAVWPDVTVTDESLTRCISDVRSVLGDSDQKIIKTIPRRGYLFAAPVSRGPGDSDVEMPTGSVPTEPSANVADRQPTYLAAMRAVAGGGARWLVLGCLVLAVAIGAGVFFSRPPNSPAIADRPSVAVMPFANASGDSRQDYFSDGISENLTTGLSRFASLFVITRDSAFKYKGQHFDAKQVGKDLGVRYLLQGSIRTDSERLRITAQLVDTDSGKQLWGENYDRDLSGLFAVQDEVTQKIVLTLVSRISKTELERTLQKSPQSLAAYEAHLRANALIRNLDRDRAAVAQARAFYQQALRSDPRYAPAIQGLANTEFILWTTPCPGQADGCEYRQQAVLDRALSLAQEAVELDGTLSEAHATLAWILRWHGRDGEAATEFARAIEINPNFVDGRYGLMLSHWGRAPEAIEYMKRIMKLDPLYPPVYMYWLGKGYFFVGNYQESIDLVRAAAARLPSSLPPQVMLGAVAAKLGRMDEAKTAIAGALRLNPDLTITEHLKFMNLVKPEDAERFADGMRKAGLPE